MGTLNLIELLVNVKLNTFFTWNEFKPIFRLSFPELDLFYFDRFCASEMFQHLKLFGPTILVKITLSEKYIQGAFSLEQYVKVNIFPVI